METRWGQNCSARMSYHCRLNLPPLQYTQDCIFLCTHWKSSYIYCKNRVRALRCRKCAHHSASLSGSSFLGAREYPSSSTNLITHGILRYLTISETLFLKKRAAARLVPMLPMTTVAASLWRDDSTQEERREQPQRKKCACQISNKNPCATETKSILWPMTTKRGMKWI